MASVSLDFFYQNMAVVHQRAAVESVTSKE
jgi:hypothetical protein